MPGTRRVRKACSGWKRPKKAERERAPLANGERDPAALPAPFRAVGECCDACFARIEHPARGDWLDAHNERGQSYASFARMSMRVAPHAHVTTIELVPVGPWGGGDGSAAAHAPSLDALCRYAAAFFGTDCRVGAPIALAEVFEEAREGGEGQLQITAGEVQRALRARRPARDVLCSVGVTMADLYVIKDGEAWNFVFGQASLMEGVGIFSFARYAPGGTFPLAWRGGAACHYDDACKRKDAGSSAPLVVAAAAEISEEQRSNMLRRSAKVLTHETAHIFGIKHCTHFECLMSGCNHLEEFDKRPLFLCPIDLRKLQAASGFDCRERYARLQSLCAEFGWSADAEWLARRMALLSVRPEGS